MDAATNPVPLTVSGNAGDPAAIDAGDTPVTLAAGLSISNGPPVDVPPPGAGFTTVTEAVPAARRSLAPIAAVNCVELTKVVARFAPFHCSCELPTKPLPVTVNVNALAPTPADAGKIEAIAGAGFGVIVNVAAVEVPPPGTGVTTVTSAEPGDRRSLAGIAAVT